MLKIFNFFKKKTKETKILEPELKYKPIPKKKAKVVTSKKRKPRKKHKK